MISDSGASAEFADATESDLLAINYTSGTTSRPKGAMITHGNGWMNSVGTLLHWPMTPADHYLWTLPMFHANGWTFTWSFTAAGAAHICLRKVDPVTVYPSMKHGFTEGHCLSQEWRYESQAPRQAPAPALGDAAGHCRRANR